MRSAHCRLVAVLARVEGFESYPAEGMLWLPPSHPLSGAG